MLPQAHPWFNIPLPSNYQSELSGLQLEQRLNTHYPRDAVHQELRLPQTLETMVGLAGKSGWMGGTDKLQVGGRGGGVECLGVGAGGVG